MTIESPPAGSNPQLVVSEATDPLHHRQTADERPSDVAVVENKGLRLLWNVMKKGLLAGDTLR